MEATCLTHWSGILGTLGVWEKHPAGVSMPELGDTFPEKLPGNKKMHFWDRSESLG